MARFTWRKSPPQGRWRGPVLHELHVDGIATGMVVQHGLHNPDDCFWYGEGRNTCNTRVDLKTAKAQAYEFYKKVRGYGDKNAKT